jgi:pimeloyl-ACP methyl ester carboxylesterase
LANLRLAAQTVFSEAVYFSRAILTMSWNPREYTCPPERASCARPPRPVLLVHGILCNSAIWRPLVARLHAAGFAPIHAINLEPLFADIDLQALSLVPELLALHEQSRGARVAIVSHSMGGLVTRALLRSVGSEMISRVITIACPHHGTRFVYGLRWPATRQMGWDSTWLQTLGTSEGGHFSVPFASIYSVEDNLVAPAVSARLAGAQMYPMRGIGHLGMLSTQAALDCVMAVLQPPVV